MLGSCWLFTHLQLHEMLSAELPGTSFASSCSYAVSPSARSGVFVESFGR